MGAVFAAISESMHRAIGDRVFPGAVLLVRFRGDLIFFEAFGHAALMPEPDPMTRETVFDLASLTKPLVTTTLLVMLVAEGRLTLDGPMARYIPEWNSGAKGGITLRHLLTHTSGLPAWRPYYQQLDPSLVGTPRGKEWIIAAAEREPLVSEPGVTDRYSDLGFIILGGVIERLVGQTLDRIAADRIFRPLGLASTAYRPLGDHRQGDDGGTPHLAATESCPWRGRTLRGEVHDDNAYAMGGVAGHAGLFADARDVDRLLIAWRNAATGSGSFLPKDLASECLTRQPHFGQGGWALGWTVATPPSTSGRHFSPRSFGHLGFTGTSIWVDPDRDLSVVLLTNRVHPDRHNQALAAFRPVIHDVIYESVVEGSAR